MKITVIIPVYNVEAYLHYAIESLLQQTYQDFEVILVDDGSTDASKDLCDHYAKEHPRIYSYHKVNGGLSDARNFGVRKAQTDWIVFLDPDDYLEPYTLELMVKIQQTFQADLVSTKVESTQQYQQYTGHQLEEEDYIHLKQYSSEEALLEMYYNEIATVSACGKLYKKSLLEMYPFPVGKIYEDLYVVAKHVQKAKSIYITPLRTYNYYQRPGSIVHSAFNKKQYDFFEAIEQNHQVLIDKYGAFSQLQKALQVKKVKGGFHIVDLIVKSGDKKEFSVVKSQFASAFKPCLLDKRMTLKFKIKYLIFMCSPNLYAVLKKVRK